jgi:hypothetical protein
MRGPDAAPIRSPTFYGDLGRDLEDTATLYTPHSTRPASSLATTTFTSSAASGKRTLSWRCSCTGYRQQKCNRKALRFYQVQHSAVVQNSPRFRRAPPIPPHKNCASIRDLDPNLALRVYCLDACEKARSGVR